MAPDNLLDTGGGIMLGFSIPTQVSAHTFLLPSACAGLIKGLLS